MEKTQKTPFFTKDKNFYRTLLKLMVIVVLQNVVAYSVNMADNIMLGAYSQDALSGAATVNMIQFMVQQLTLAVADSLVVVGSQYWGEKRTAPIRNLTGIALCVGAVLGTAVFLWTSIDPRGILHLFTTNEAYVEEGVKYLNLIRFTYPLYIGTTILLASMRTVETVSIALKISITSLLLDVGINYPLIFGKFGFPELGVTGAAIGTLAARVMEFCVILFYVIFRDKKLRLFREKMFCADKDLVRSYFKIFIPTLVSNTLWSLATPIQTSILGHLSSDAISANSASTTMYQYLKIIAIGEASASAVVIGKSLGEGKTKEEIKSYTWTLQILYIVFGCFLATALFFLRIPFLSFYDLSPTAREMANQILTLLCFIFIGMAYQMPTSVGIIKGGGDVKYILCLNLISTWGIIMPLSFLAAFRWNLPIVWIVAILNSDQIFKCIPIAIHTNRFRWINKLTK